MSKTCVAPLKETTPHLKLVAALTLAKLMKSVSDSLDGVIAIDEIFCWIREKGKRNKKIVQNRVSQIRSLWSKEFWWYCPTDQNPSDITSRGAKCSELVSNCLWWNGPQFLQEDKVKWPASISCAATEIVKCEEKSSSILNTLVTNNSYHSSIGNIFQCKPFSSTDKLLCVTAPVCRFINNIINRDHRVDQLDITLVEIKVAKIL